MPMAARLTDCTTHAATPLAPGVGSPTVFIAGAPAWRALPAGVGDGIEKASDAIQKLTLKPMIRPPEVVKDLADIQAGLSQSAAAAVQSGNPAAAGATAGALTGITAANVALTAAYTTAAAVPGGEPAAATAYALGLQQALAAAAAASIAAVAAMTDTHICPLCTPVPHGPGVVTQGSKTVFIGKLPAARQLDKVFEAAGGADPIAIGCPTVNIG
jgi:uncharacterized Zn-binding protein involved in type VI secretion